MIKIETQDYINTHANLLETIKESHNRHTVLINAFGGAGAGKSTACLHICSELKKQGYVAEYVPEYAKELVWDENWDMLNGSEKHQFEILQEQVKRQDRLFGKVDFIVTDAPILLNKVYNNELTPEYENMLVELYKQYTSFNFVVERDVNNFEKEGRIHNLEQSIQKDNEIKQMLSDYQLYYGTYNHSTIDKIIANAIKTFQKKEAHDMANEYQTTGKYQGRIYDPEMQRTDKDGNVKTGGYISIKGDSIKGIEKMLTKMFEEQKRPYSKNCKIDILNEDTGNYQNIKSYDAELKKDITRVYLEIPFDQEAGQLDANAKASVKEAGAKWDDKAKKYYIEAADVDCHDKRYNDFLPNNYKAVRGTAYMNTDDKAYKTFYGNTKDEVVSKALRFRAYSCKQNDGKSDISDSLFIKEYDQQEKTFNDAGKVSLSEESKIRREARENQDQNQEQNIKAPTRKPAQSKDDEKSDKPKAKSKSKQKEKSSKDKDDR